MKAGSGWAPEISGSPESHVSAAGGGVGDGLKRLNYRVGKWDVAFARHVERLRAEKITILCGDLNCAHKVRICAAEASKHVA